MSVNLHIVSFNIPYPPDYGGVIDVYYKIKALSEAGVSVHLHNFMYGREQSDQLEEICATVRYYKRKPMWHGIFTNKPMIVDSRRAQALKKNLIEENFPILFEGLHACYYLTDPALKSRRKLVRMHNNEPEYYLSPAKREKSFLTSLYYYEEYKRLKIFEHQLKYADAILAIAKHEEEYYKTTFSNTHYIGPFHGNKSVSSKTGKGKYALYHGNLAISENSEAALYLVNQVFANTDLQLIIAGLQAPSELRKSIKQNPNIKLIDSPADDELHNLIAEAHINILPSFQKTGIKLKLVNSLFNGRFCIANHLMVDATGLDKYCTIADTPLEMQQAVYNLMDRDFDSASLDFRKFIESEFSDQINAQKVIQLLKREPPH